MQIISISLLKRPKQPHQPEGKESYSYIVTMYMSLSDKLLLAFILMLLLDNISLRPTSANVNKHVSDILLNIFI